jgi:hypothetical protein
MNQCCTPIGKRTVCAQLLLERCGAVIEDVRRGFLRASDQVGGGTEQGYDALLRQHFQPVRLRRKPGQQPIGKTVPLQP